MPITKPYASLKVEFRESGVQISFTNFDKLNPNKLDNANDAILAEWDALRRRAIHTRRKEESKDDRREQRPE